MTDLSVQKPVEVSPSATGDQLSSALRSLLVAAGAYASGMGWIPADVAGALVTVIWLGVPFVWGQIKVRTRHDQLLTVAADPRVPDSVARVKG